MQLNKLPEGLRVKLSKEDQHRLWEEVEIKGMTKIAEETGYPRNRLYSWKSKDIFLPIAFISRFLDSAEVKAIKSQGRGNEIRDLDLSFDQIDELATRFNSSVYINRDGVPFYRAKEYSLISRFRELLEMMGEFDISVYNRDFNEVRFPKAVQLILSNIDYEQDFAALVDESGEIKDGKIILDNREISVEEFEGRLYSDEKRGQLAIEKGDRDELEDIIADQISKANSLL